MNGDGVINESGFQIEGRLGALADIFNRKQPYPVDINLKISDLVLTVSGTFADYADGKGLKLQLTSEERDLAKLLKTLKLDAPPLGRLKFEATLSGDVAAPRLSDLDLVISDDSSLEFSANGSITNLAGGEGTDISLSGMCRNEAILKWIFPDNWQIVEEFKFNSALRRRQAGFWIEDIDAHMVNDKGVTLEAGGRLQLGDIRDTVHLKEVDLHLHLVSKRTDAIRPLLTDALPEIGSVDARGRLVGPLDRLCRAGRWQNPGRREFQTRNNGTRHGSRRAVAGCQSGARSGPCAR